MSGLGHAQRKVRKSDTRRARGNRTGFTTGACSAAAARAATLGLLTGPVPEHVVCLLPTGRDVSFAVLDCSVATAGPERCAHPAGTYTHPTVHKRQR